MPGCLLSGSEGDVDYRQANRQVQWNVISTVEEGKNRMFWESMGPGKLRFGQERRVYHQDL